MLATIETKIALHARSRLRADANTLAFLEFRHGFSDLNDFADDFVTSDAEVAGERAPAACDESVSIGRMVRKRLQPTGDGVVITAADAFDEGSASRVDKSEVLATDTHHSTRLRS